jgi:hypothetical protein
MKNTKKFFCILSMLGLVFPSLMVQAQDFGPPSGVPSGFSQQPSQEEIQRMMQEAQQKAQEQAQQPGSQNPGLTGQGYTMEAGSDGKVFCKYTDSSPSQSTISACESAMSGSQAALEANMKNGQMPGGMPTGMPSGMPDLNQMDFSKFGAMPANIPEGGFMPTFMGKSAGISEGADAGISKLANALDEIKNGIVEATDGITQMKEGQIKVDPAMEESVKKAKIILDEAVALFAEAKYQETGAKLGELTAVGFDKKYAAFADTKGVSTDLINDIRKKINGVMGDLEKNLDPEEFIQAKADILTQLTYLDEADKLVKAGKKKEAGVILKNMKKENGEGAAMADMASGKITPTASQIKIILDKIEGELSRGSLGMDKVKDSGVESLAEMQALFEQSKADYATAKNYYDSGDYKKAYEKLKEMKAKNYEETFLTFKVKVASSDQLRGYLDEAKNGVKALDITITNAQEFGMDVTELQKLRVELSDLVAKAEEAYNKKSMDEFLTYMSLADQLHVRDKVNEIIKTVADKRAKEILGDGLTALNNTITQLDPLLDGVNDPRFKNALTLYSDVKGIVAEAQAIYDQGDYMNGGRVLDGATAKIIRIGNILKDNKFKLSPEITAIVNDLIKKFNSSSDLNNASADTINKSQAMLNTASSDNMMENKMSISELNPALFDKVIAFRQKDKNMIDSTINNVLPYLSDENRQAMLEGKINLLQEAQSSNRTIDLMKKMKGVSQSVVKDLQGSVDKIKNYNFTADISAKLDEKLTTLNDNIQSGQIKDVKEINAYVKVIKEETDKSLAAASTEKMKTGLIPARNIDDNNAMFDEVKYLQTDGALKADKKGNINLDQRATSAQLKDMIAKTTDTAVNVKMPTNMTVAETAKTIFAAYNVTPDVNLKNSKSAATFLTGIGADMKSTDINRKATVKDVADILSAADQRWGTN